MDLEQLKAQAKGVPPIAWVIGIGVVLLLLMFKGKSAGSGVSGPVGGGSGGGDSSPDLNQEFTTFAAQQQAEQAAFEKTITDLIKKPSAGGSGTGGAAGSVSKTLLTISKHSTAIYSKPGGRIVGHVSTASFYVQRQKIGGRWWYKVLGTKSGAKSSFVGKYLPAEPWENIKTVTAPK